MGHVFVSLCVRGEMRFRICAQRTTTQRPFQHVGHHRKVPDVYLRVASCSVVLSPKVRQLKLLSVGEGFTR